MENQINNQIEEQATEETIEQVEEQPIEETVKTFTQEEVNELVKKRLAKERNKIKKELEKERDQAERLANMSESEREKELFRQEKEQFEKERNQFAKERLLLETNKQLIDRNLPIEFAEYLLSDSAEEVLENINSFATIWNTALEEAVNKKLSGSSPTTPKSNLNNKNTAYTKEQIESMSTDEIIKNYDQVMNALKYINN